MDFNLVRIEKDLHKKKKGAENLLKVGKDIKEEMIKVSRNFPAYKTRKISCNKYAQLLFLFDYVCFLMNIGVRNAYLDFEKKNYIKSFIVFKDQFVRYWPSYYCVLKQSDHMKFLELPFLAYRYEAKINFKGSSGEINEVFYRGKKISSTNQKKPWNTKNYPDFRSEGLKEYLQEVLLNYLKSSDYKEFLGSQFYKKSREKYEKAAETYKVKI